MKVFDAHSDILNDVANKRELSIENIIENYHLDRLQRGNVFGSIFSIWVEPEHSNDYRKRTFEILSAASAELYRGRDKVKFVKRFEDFTRAERENKTAILLGLEGMASVKEDIDLVYFFYQCGIRAGGLTWNEENTLATGISGNSNRGITKYGVGVIEVMEQLGMVLDVSHLNEKSFWDVTKHAKRPYIASHSNVFSLRSHPRNLKDEQIKAIADSGGVVGINAWPDFVDENNPTIEKLATHIDYIVRLVGIEYVGLGFDFCHFLDNGTLDSLLGNGNTIPNLTNAGQIQNLVLALKQKGYGDEELNKIAHLNFMRVFKEILK